MPSNESKLRWSHFPSFPSLHFSSWQTKQNTTLNARACDDERDSSMYESSSGGIWSYLSLASWTVYISALISFVPLMTLTSNCSACMLSSSRILLGLNQGTLQHIPLDQAVHQNTNRRGQVLAQKICLSEVLIDCRLLTQCWYISEYCDSVDTRGDLRQSTTPGLHSAEEKPSLSWLVSVLLKLREVDKDSVDGRLLC